MVNKILQIGNWTQNCKRKNPQRGRVYNPNGIAPTLSCMGGGNLEPCVLLSDENNRKGEQKMSIRVRKLTPKECWRLMGFVDNDFDSAKDAMNKNLYGGNDRSSSQLYKQAGNSIVVDVLLHIMENLYKAMPYLFEDIQVGSFFSGIGAFEKALTLLEVPVADTPKEAPLPDEPELTQIGYINDYNGDANRIYDGEIARVLKAEAGGGGAKTGWYRVSGSTHPSGSAA